MHEHDVCTDCDAYARDTRESTGELFKSEHRKILHKSHTIFLCDNQINKTVVSLMCIRENVIAPQCAVCLQSLIFKMSTYMELVMVSVVLVRAKEAFIFSQQTGTQ